MLKPSIPFAGRKKAYRGDRRNGLPPLPTPNLRTSAPHKTQRLLDIIRGVARSVQADHPITFYSVRDVASNFRVPISTVSAVYKRLEQEGFLRIVRGSKTTLRGRKHDRKLSVRGFVGLPASLSCFLMLQDYRMFFIRIRRELRLRGFATAMVFIEKERDYAFKERLKKYEVDTVIWFLPESSARQTIHALHDIGIRVIGVSDGGLPTIRCRYEIIRTRAIKNILASWRSTASADNVVIVTDQTRHSAADEQRLKALLDSENIPHEFLTVSTERIEAVLSSLEKKTNCGVLIAATAASMFAFRNPEQFSELISRQPVGLIDGPVCMPFVKPSPAPVDLVLVDWQLLAEHIVTDLIRHQALDFSQVTEFEAESKLRVPLSQYAQRIWSL